MNERDRLVKIMECEGLNAKQFSTEIGVSAGTISNIMGGRNKPSLDVLQAVLRRFRSISCLWLIMGAGSMYLNNAADGGPSEETPTLPFPDDEPKQTNIQQVTATTIAKTEPVVSSSGRAVNNLAPVVAAPERTVRKVMIFYSDGTFEER